MKLYPCGKFLLSVPDDHRLPAIQGIDVLYDRGYHDILVAIAEWKPASTFVDVGANVGDTAAFFRTHVANPIVCVEGGETFLTYLRDNATQIDPNGIAIIEAFVGTDTANNNALEYQENTGTGYIRPSNGKSQISFIEVKEILNRACDFGDGSVALFKTDTDGMDALIIQSALEAGMNNPMFFECDYMITQSMGEKTVWARIFDRLEAQQWSAVIFDNHGRPILCLDELRHTIIADIQGWIHLQHKVGVVHIHYLDLFVFPPSARSAYEKAAAAIRSKLLAPYQY